MNARPRPGPTVGCVCVLSVGRLLPCFAVPLCFALPWYALPLLCYVLGWLHSCFGMAVPVAYPLLPRVPSASLVVFGWVAHDEIIWSPRRWRQRKREPWRSSLRLSSWWWIERLLRWQERSLGREWPWRWCVEVWRISWKCEWRSEESEGRGGWGLMRWSERLGLEVARGLDLDGFECGGVRGGRQGASGHESAYAGRVDDVLDGVIHECLGVVMVFAVGDVFWASVQLGVSGTERVVES